VNATSGGYTALLTSLSTVSGGYAGLQAVKSAGSLFGDLILNKDGGNVGIGTTTPNAKLDVSGNLQVSGEIKANGNAGAAGNVLVSGGSGAPTRWAPSMYSGSQRVSKTWTYPDVILVHAATPTVAINDVRVDFSLSDSALVLVMFSANTYEDSPGRRAQGQISMVYDGDLAAANLDPMVIRTIPFDINYMKAYGSTSKTFTKYLGPGNHTVVPNLVLTSVDNCVTCTQAGVALDYAEVTLLIISK